MEKKQKSDASNSVGCSFNSGKRQEAEATVNTLVVSLAKVIQEKTFSLIAESNQSKSKFKKLNKLR